MVLSFGEETRVLKRQLAHLVGVCGLGVGVYGLGVGVDQG